MALTHSWDASAWAEVRATQQPLAKGSARELDVEQMTLAQFNTMIGFPEIEALEQRYGVAANRQVARD